MSPELNATVGHLIDSHRLPVHYAYQFGKFIVPLANRLACAPGPRIIGIQGSQGSGKSTLADFLKAVLEIEHSLSVEVVSLDDFYLSKFQRSNLASTVHPLLQTRGVPGTHDTNLMISVFDRFKQSKSFTLPSFDKSIDDLKLKTDWRTVESQPDLLIFEGWCVGASPQHESELFRPINDLEQIQDADKKWRRYVNQTLSDDYAEAFAKIDELVVLEVPSFKCVYRWRSEQEQKLIARLKEAGQSTASTMTVPQLKHFIQHYQRLTQHCLTTLPTVADHVLGIDEDHRFVSLKSAADKETH
ncbi:MAG: hypothetical protein MK188_05515 [Gammaproteobacteria bacterium]|nr:hypothetical protein [Gammaproteobacteria bacterium]